MELRERALFRQHAFIDGAWVDAASRKSYGVENPATGAVIRTVPSLDAEEVRAVVARARAAQPAWEALGFEGRGRVLQRAQKWVLDNGDRVVATIVAETGKTHEDAQLAELSYAASAFGFWAKHAPRYLADERQRSYVVDGWNLTGDTYLRDGDGYYWYQARTDDMIITSGYSIAGPEVEQALLGHPDVLEVGVVGAPDPERGTIIKAYVVLRDGATAGPGKAAELQAFAKQVIAPYKYPRAIEFLDALPRTESGKVQRYRLRQSAAGQA